VKAADLVEPGIGEEGVLGHEATLPKGRKDARGTGVSPRQPAA